jgi:hypothetical protein
MKFRVLQNFLTKRKETKLHETRQFMKTGERNRR